MALAQARHGDVPELLPGIGAVDPRRLVIVLGDALQAREIEDHREADGAPGIGGEGGGEGGVEIRQPPAGEEAQPHGLEDDVDGAEIRIVHPAPDDADGNQRQHGRRVIDGPQHHGAGQVAVEPERQQQADGGGDDERAQRPPNVVDERDAGDVVVEQGVDVILEADELGERGQPVPLEEARIERHGHGVDEKADIDDEGRREEQIGRQHGPPVPAFGDDGSGGGRGR